MTTPCSALATSTKLMTMTVDRVPGFAQRVQEVLEAAGLNQSQAMHRLGVAFTTVTKWVNDRGEPRLVNLAPLAELGGVTIDWLVTGKGPKYASKALNEVDEAKRMERLERYRKAVDSYLASGLADDISPKTVTLLRSFDFASLGTASPQVKDVHRVRDLIDNAATLGQFSVDGESGE